MFAQALGESVSPGVENRAKEPRRPEFIVKGLTPPQQLADGPGNRIMSPFLRLTHKGQPSKYFSLHVKTLFHFVKHRESQERTRTFASREKKGNRGLFKAMQSI
jgi:hypothetical protein